MPLDNASGASGSTSGSANDSSHTKLPIFWVTRPELWFIQAEAAFIDRNPPITSDAAKFSQVLRVLPNDVLEKVEYVITGEEPVGGRYAALKGALTDSFGRSTAHRHAELIALTKDGTLGDRKPTEFLMHMRSLHGNSIETWERATLLNALPPQVRAILSNSNAANNKRLAQEANSIMEENGLSRVTAGVRSIDFGDDQDHYTAVEAVASRPQDRRRRDFSDDRSDRRDRGEGQQRKQKQRLCYNHSKFGNRAYSCKGGDCGMRDAPLSHPPAAGNGRAGR